MTRDRAHSSEFSLTHEFLAYMLGVRRVGITTAARALERRSLIDYSRGKITILDNKALEATACECYAQDIAVYARILAPRRGSASLRVS